MAHILIYLMPSGDVEIECRPGGGEVRCYIPRQRYDPPASGQIFGIGFEEFKTLSHIVTNDDGEIITKIPRSAKQ